MEQIKRLLHEIQCSDGSDLDLLCNEIEAEIEKICSCCKIKGALKSFRELTSDLENDSCWRWPELANLTLLSREVLREPTHD